MPLPAGTGMSRRSFLLRSAGGVLAVYGAGALSPRHLEAGIAQAAAAAPPKQPVIVSIFMEGGWDALSVLAPVKEAAYHQLRPQLGRKEGEGVPFSEDETLMWHPQAAGLAQLHGEGKVTVFPAIGYDPPDESHFTSRHYWEVGELNTQGRTGWMGRYLDVAGEPTTPCRASRSTTRWRRRWPPRGCPWRPSRRRPTTASGPTAWTNRSPPPTLEAFGRLGSLARLDRPRAGAHGLAGHQHHPQQVAPFADVEGKPPFTSPVTYPTSGGEFPSRLAVLADMLADESLPIKCVSLNAVGSYDTHSDEATTLPPTSARRSNPSSPSSATSKRAGSTTASLIQLWSEFGRRPQENGSGTDHGAAGRGVPDRQPRAGQDGRRIPGPDKLDENENLINTSDFRAVYAGLLGQWLGSKRAS